MLIIFLKKNFIRRKKYFNDKSIVVVGRLVKQKNHTFLINLMKKLIERGNKINLIILGKGSEDSNIRELIKYLCLENNIFLLGEKDNPYKYIKKPIFYG